MLRLRWRARPGEQGQLVKITCDRGSPLGLHTHDYPEIFWIEEGRCRHSINGTQELLQAGDLVFIRAPDRHQFIAIGRNRFTMTNLACHPQAILTLAQWHPKPFANWFDESAPMPLKLHLDSARLSRLKQITLDLAAATLDALHLEGFCFDLVRLLEKPKSSLAGLARCPDWLQNAVLKAQEPEVFTQGVSGLVHAAGRSAEHVNRLCRVHLQKTPTQIINHYRMSYAEKQLRLTSLPVTDISLGCGYSTTSQFYRSFRRSFRQTPLAYRRRMRGA